MRERNTVELMEKSSGAVKTSSQVLKDEKDVNLRESLRRQWDVQRLMIWIQHTQIRSRN